MKDIITKEQMFEYFRGNASIIQKHELESWLQNPDHVELYFHYLEEFEKQNLAFKADSESEIRKIWGKIENQSQPYEMKLNNLRKNTSVWVAAACVLALLFLTYLFQDKFFLKEYHSEYGKITNLSLSDGTKVTLNSNSSLMVPRFGFGKNTRRVILEGEAYFSVIHSPTNQKFEVQTSKDFKVEVLGTEFSVKNRNKGIQVLLDRGKVKIHYSKAKKDILMKPGDLVKLDKNGSISKEAVKETKTFTAWRSHKFIFDKTSLSELAIVIKENFGLDVNIKSVELENKTISGEIEAQNVDELLEAISNIFDLQIEKNNNTIEIY
jgi:transmembrane sensor